MDLDNAIQKHAEWKTKFRTAISQHEKVDAAAIGKDNVCELGQWLAGPARHHYGTLPEYRECMANHTAFHVEAGKVAVIINAGKYAEAEEMMSSGTPYARASTAAGGAIFALKIATQK
jgi:methyl-accepting chemotaxis protein